MPKEQLKPKPEQQSGFKLAKFVQNAINEGIVDAMKLVSAERAAAQQVDARSMEGATQEGPGPQVTEAVKAEVREHGKEGTEFTGVGADNAQGGYAANAKGGIKLGDGVGEAPGNDMASLIGDVVEDASSIVEAKMTEAAKEDQSLSAAKAAQMDPGDPQDLKNDGKGPTPGGG